MEVKPLHHETYIPPEVLPLAPDTTMTDDTVHVGDTVSFMPTDFKVMSSMHHSSYAKMIDNRFVNYLAIKLRCGVIAMCRTNVLTLCQSALKDLNADFTRCLEIVPNSVRAFIKRTRIWVNLSYTYGPSDNPRLLRHTTAHHHHAWLVW